MVPVAGWIERPLLGRRVRQQLGVEEREDRAGPVHGLAGPDGIPERGHTLAAERALELLMMRADGAGGLCVGERWP